MVLQLLPLSGLKILGYASNIPPTEVINLTNQKRAEAGLNALSNNETLAQAARAKGQDMLAQGYWAHTAPDGTQPWKFFTDAGYRYRYAGENLARDFADPRSAVEAWMASPSHRDNLLSPKYNEIGIAVVEGDLGGVDTTLIVQLFGATFVDTTPQLPLAQVNAAVPAITTAPTPPLAPSLTPTPSPEPTRVEIAVAINAAAPPPIAGIVAEREVLISPFKTTKNVSFMVIGLLLIVLVVDGLVVSNKKITRIGGRTFAHLAFLGMILAIVVIARAGKIL